MKVYLKCLERVSYVLELEVIGNLMKNESLIIVNILVCIKWSLCGDNLVVLICGGLIMVEDCCFVLLFWIFYVEMFIYSVVFVCFEKMGEDSFC